MQTCYQEGFSMKMNGQSRTFVKQVKFDLLALSDTDLFQIIQQWIKTSNLSQQPFDKTENIWLALGFTRQLPDNEDLTSQNVDISATEIDNPILWIAPIP